jgi:hypothetical protein
MPVVAELLLELSLEPPLVTSLEVEDEDDVDVEVVSDDVVSDEAVLDVVVDVVSDEVVSDVVADVVLDEVVSDVAAELLFKLALELVFEVGAFDSSTLTLTLQPAKQDAARQKLSIKAKPLFMLITFSFYIIS